MKLNKYDYELLEFLQIQGKSSLETILKKFPDDKYGTKYRLRMLSDTNKDIYSDENNYFSDLKNIKYENYVVEHFHENTESYYFHLQNSKNIFSLSSKGRKVLIDYKLYAKELKKENKKRNFRSRIQTILSIIIAIANLILALKS